MNTEILYEEIVEELKKVTPDYAEQIASNILIDVKADIEETADEEYNTADVRLAIGRTLLKHSND